MFRHLGLNAKESDNKTSFPLSNLQYLIGSPDLICKGYMHNSCTCVNSSAIVQFSEQVTCGCVMFIELSAFTRYHFS